MSKEQQNSRIDTLYHLEKHIRDKFPINDTQRAHVHRRLEGTYTGLDTRARDKIKFGKSRFSVPTRVC